MKSWTQSDTLVLAMDGCAICGGTGVRPGTRNSGSPCNCVLRAVFRLCYERFRACARKERTISQVQLELSTGGAQRSYRWTRKDEEFVADFYLVSKRNLDEFEWKVFRLRFLLGADWHLCCAKLNVDRGTFFHAVYRIEEKLGRVFRDLTPYPLFPLDEYFGGTTRACIQPCVTPGPEPPAKPPGRTSRPRSPIRPNIKAA